MVEAERTIRPPVLLAIGLGAFLAQLDGTILNVALPAVSRSFNQPGLRTVQPVITAYLAATVALLPLLGLVADRVGRKRMFLCGFAIFGAASACCALASSIASLVAFRILQACGGALLSGTSLALVAGNSGATRGHALGRLAIVFALSGLLGPPIGGGLVQVFGWRSVFWLNIPLASLGLAVAARTLPEDMTVRVSARLDLFGAALFAAATACAAAGVSDLDVTLIGDFAIRGRLLAPLGAALYIALFIHETRLHQAGSNPFLDLRLLQSRDYGLGLLAAFLHNATTIMLFVLVPFWLNRGWHVSSGALGAIFLPVALTVGGLSPFAGKRSDRAGPRLLTTLGSLLGAASALLLALQATNLLWPGLLLAMCGLGAGMALFGAPNNSAILGSVAERALASAGSMLSVARTLGVITGVGLGSTAFDALSSTRGPDDAARIIFIAAALVFLANATLCWMASMARSRKKAGYVSDPAL